MRKIINGASIELGTCYYPEHWDKSMWEDDLNRMKEVGIGTVRIAEFAWSKVEPREGEYTYEFFDEFLDLAHSKGMQVIFCTPSATPPAWLTKKYPETLNANRNGQMYEHGSRRHYNYNSPVYREKAANIAEKFAKHYAKHPAIIGWQIDNELNCETDEFYSESDTVAFREFLKERYVTIDSLNEAWGTVFWNQTYNEWDEITLPGNTIFNTHNPHKLLDYSRFVSASARSFCKMQSDILRKYIKPDDFITTNGFFGNLDYHKLNQESLDFMTYDSYPNFGYCIDGYNEQDPFKDRWSSCNLAEVRAMSGQFGIMEQQSGANGWYNRMEAPTPKPGQMTLWTMQSIAHGADYISYFRWRTCTFGTEMYWHGILDYSGRENRRLREVAQIHKKLLKMQDIAGSEFVAKVAIVKDYDNEWDARFDNWHSRVSKVSHDSWVMALQQSHIPYDYLYMYDDTDIAKLAKYEVLIYPHALILTKERMQTLEKYVENGGILIMGARTGYKDITGKCVMEYLPGLASKVTGTDIPEYSYVAPDDGKVYVDWDGEKVEAAVFNDLLAPVGENAKVLATYDNSYYKGTPALICNQFGKGKAYYFGGAFAVDTAKLFLDRLNISEIYGDILELPKECELAIREKAEKRFFFVLNYSGEKKKIKLNLGMRDILEDKTITGDIVLEPYEVKVLV